MTPRERCAATIVCRPVDRPPTYIPAIACSVASEILGRKALAGTGSLHYAEVLAHARGPAAHAEFEGQLRRDLVDLHRALGVDVFHPPWRMNVRPSVMVDERTFVFGEAEGEHEVWRYLPETADFRPIRTVRRAVDPENRAREALERAKTNQEVALVRVERDLAPHAELARELGEKFYYVMAGAGISAGYDADSLIALASVPEVVGEKLMLDAELGVAIGKALVKCGLPPVLLGGGDLAGTRGMIYSPGTFERVVLPAYRKLNRELMKAGVHYAFRSDGDVWTIADMLFVDARCQGFGEADRDAGMSVARLRERYPRLVVWGNMSSAFLLRATAAEVREECKRIEEEAGGVGIFRACSNAIVTGTPAANVEALLAH